MSFSSDATGCCASLRARLQSTKANGKSERDIQMDSEEIQCINRQRLYKIAFAFPLCKCSLKVHSQLIKVKEKAKHFFDVVNASPVYICTE